MKHLATSLVTIFAVLCGTGVSPVLAVSISSEKIDTFMTLPDWMPTSVDAEHTFGSAEHTNATHRVTSKTLAAVEAIFDAYYERVFFTSEGRSNDWDVAEYGPRPVSEGSLKYLSFTNQHVFAYRNADTNIHSRTVTDTRRLVEFANLHELSSRLGSFFASPEGAGVLNRMHCIPTWEPYYSYPRGRAVFAGSSWLPGALRPEPFGWRGTFPDFQDWAITNFCLPFCECPPDVFKYDSSYRDPGRNAIYLHRNWISGVDCGHLTFDSTAGGHSYLRRLQDSRPWVFSTVGQLIDEKFPAGVASNGIYNATRRLVPDDYVTPSCTSDWRLVGSEILYVDFGRLRQDGPTSLDPGDYRYDSIKSYDIHAGVISNLVVEDVIHLDALAFPDEITFAPVEGAERVTLSPGPSWNWSPIGYVYTSADGNVWYWGNSSAQLQVDSYKFVVVTNSVTTNSSMLATASRILAGIDRTYELAELNASAAGWPPVSENKRYMSSGRAEYSATVPFRAESFGEWEYDGQGVSKSFSNIESVRPESLELVEITSSNSVETVSANFDTRVRLRSSGVIVDGGGGHPTLSLDGSYFSYNPETIPPEGHLYYHGIYPDGGEILVVSYDANTGQERSTSANAFILDDAKVEFMFSVQQRSVSYVTAEPRQSAVDRIYPYYGPGALSFSTGRVRECYSSLLAAVVSCRENFSIDDDLTWARVKDLYGDVIYAMTSTRAHSNEAIARTVYDAVRVGGWARNKLLDVARQAGVNPEAGLRPDITLVANSDKVCGYSGGRIEVSIVGSSPSTKVWPELKCDFVLNDAAEDPEFVPEASSDPFSADLLVSDPLVSTAWNWKALKTERSNQ